MPDSDGNPTSEAEARSILRSGAGLELRNAAESYVVPIFWVGSTKGGPRGVLHSGTGFFLRIGEPTLFVTAAHVIRKLERDRLEHGSEIQAQLMDVSIDPLQSLLDIDDELDIATILIPLDLPTQVGKWIYQRPADQWPPPPPVEGRGLFFAGYPGIYREEPESATVSFGAYGGLATATSISPRNIVSQLDRAEIEPLAGLPPPPRNAWLGGMSGAPGWTLTQLGWRLAGVLYEYSTEYELFYFRPASCIRADGTLQR